MTTDLTTLGVPLVDGEGNLWALTVRTVAGSTPWFVAEPGASFGYRWASQGEAEAANLRPYTAPAALDPDNPEDLRVLRDATLKLRPEADDKEYGALGTVAIMLAAKIVRIEYEAEVAAQDKADRERAEQHATRLRAPGTGLWEDSVEDFLAGVRTVRAERAARGGEQ